MYRGKRYRRRKNNKPLLLLVSLALVLSVAAGGTVAFLVHQSETVKNVFSVAEVPIKVEESFVSNVKKNVKIKHIGDSSDRDAFVRATVVANWVDGKGNVYSEKPVLDEDYTITWNKNNAVSYGERWEQKGDYWYYMEPLEPGETTSDLIKKCEVKGTAPADGYKLSVEILAQSIQSDGTDGKGNKPIELAWGVDIENGKLKNASIKD